TLKSVGLVGGTGNHRSITARIGILPRHRHSRFAGFERLHLRRIRAPLVIVVHPGADPIADEAADRRAGETSRDALAGSTADRRGAERQAAAIETGKLHHDRKPEPRPRLRLVETTTAAGHLFALLRRKSRAVVIDHDAYGAAIVSWIRFLRERLNRHPRLRPFAGIVDKIANHFFEILLLATEAGALRRVDID